MRFKRTSIKKYSNQPPKPSVYLIEGATQRVLDFLEAQKAEIIIQGKIYAETLRAAQECVEADVHGVMVPAYDHELVWEGHSSMIKEIHGQLAKKPDAVLCSVGGGGLLGGIMLGLAEVGWDDGTERHSDNTKMAYSPDLVPVVALETLGCNCFHHSIALNKGYPIELPTYAQGVKDEMTGIQLAHFTEFHSIATGSLGASQPSARVVAKALARDGGIKCASIPDFLSMKAAVQFAEDHQTLVEPACSTTLAAAFSPELFNHLVPLTDKKAEDRTVVFIVCGGFKITLAEMAEYQRIMNQSLTEKEVTCLVDGENVAVAV